MRPIPSDPAKGKGRAVEQFEEDNIAVGREERFFCTNCESWNVRLDGELVQEQAAYDSTLNTESFSRRGTPAKSLRAQVAPNPFCRYCVSNQTIRMHILASLEPEGVDAARKAMDERYPVLCRNCAPTVESILAERDRKARATLMQPLPATTGHTETWWRTKQAVWRIRGLLWYATHALAIAHIFAGSVNHFESLRPLFFIYCLSFLWTFWNPLWLSLKLAQARGRRLKLARLPAYLVAQGLLFALRLVLPVYPLDVLSAGCLSVCYLTMCLIRPAIARQPSPKLLRSPISGTKSLEDVDPAQNLDALSLATKLVTPPEDHHQPQGNVGVQASDDGSAMDWEPLPEAIPTTSDSIDFAPKRFPDSKTGLEGLLNGLALEQEPKTGKGWWPSLSILARKAKPD